MDRIRLRSAKPRPLKTMAAPRVGTQKSGMAIIQVYAGIGESLAYIQCRSDYL